MAAFAKIAARDAVGATEPVHKDGDHLDAAGAWLKRAHDHGRGGVSYGYGLREGWGPPYPETSGYISSTLFDLAESMRDADYRTRAIAVCHWLNRIQNRDGSIANPRYGLEGIVFDTAQVLEGFVRAFRETGEATFLEAADRAAAWLVSAADDDQRWTRHDFLGIPHVYNTRTAWRLLQLNEVAPRAGAIDIARVNLDWAVAQQNSAGWFDRCGFRRAAIPFTHTIAYTIEGLLGAGLLLQEKRYVDAARRSADAALGHLRSDGFLPGRIDLAGNGDQSFSCLSGSCQLALVWGRLYDLGGEERFREAAQRALEYVMRGQALRMADPDIRGAIKGSQPLWGRYSPFVFPSWATKFFVDALIVVSRWR